jgi:hypothetical protein
MKRPKAYVWYFLALLGMGAGAIVTPILFNLSQLLTPEQVAEARSLWEAKGPASYDLRWLDRTDRDELGDTYEVKVRNGEVTELRVNDRLKPLSALTPEQREGLTVPGFFDRMLSHLKEEEKGRRRNFTTAYFNPKLGFPARYVRRVRGTKERLEWIVKLTPVESSASGR